jgi:hypothetical protein
VRLKRVGVKMRSKSESTKGKPKSPETRRRMLEAQRRKWADPNYRAYQSELIKARHAARRAKKSQPTLL